MSECKVNKVMQFRVEHNWTQSQLAEKIGYSKEHICLIETSKQPITKKLAIKLVGLDENYNIDYFLK